MSWAELEQFKVSEVFIVAGIDLGNTHEKNIIKEDSTVAIMTSFLLSVFL